MGKLITFITILIFIDLLFLVTGQICSEEACTLSSLIFNAILDIGQISFTDLFKNLIGDALSLFTSEIGILSLLATGGVIVGAFIATRETLILFIPMAVAMAFIAGDFVIITARLVELNPVLGTFIMAPIGILYIFTIVEWLRLKD